jgi:hypothetical protein
MAVATAGAPARRDRHTDAHERVPRTPIQLDERPDPLAPSQGIALAIALGLGAWALAIAAFLVL